MSILAVTACLTTISTVVYGQSYIDFNSLNDGAILNQPGWWSDHPENGSDAFLVMDEQGVTHAPGDKALIISSADTYVKIVKDEAVSWEPGETFIYELDFQIGLSRGDVESAQNGLAVMLGNRSLIKESRWVISIGINPEGKWLVRGNAPHWENIQPLPPETFVARPAEGESAVSQWYHLKITSIKSTTPNTFKTQLMITDMDGGVILQHTYKEDPVEGEMTDLWNQPTISTGFSARDNINGLVCIDNISLASVPAAKPKPKGLGALLP